MLLHLLLAAVVALPSSQGDDTFAALANARELIYRGQYDEALRQLDQSSRSQPEHPAPDFYSAVALVWKSLVDSKLDTGSRDFDSEIERFLDRAVSKAEALRREGDDASRDRADALYYIGAAQALLSRVKLYQNHAIPAARLSRSAQDTLDQLLEARPDYTDALFAAGSIYYQVGALTDSTLGRLAAVALGAKSLPKGDRERGLAYLKTAADNAPTASVDAMLALIEVYALKENRHSEALPLASDLVRRYPENQTFHRHLLRILLEVKDRKGVEQAANGILDLVRRNTPGFGVLMKREADRAKTLARAF